MADASPVKRHKGKFVLLAVAAALAAYVIIGHLGIAWFDATTEHPGAEQAIKDAEAASVQWLTYLSRSGRPDTDLGKRAAEDLGKGADARATNDMEAAQRASLAAWQAYANAFRSEAEQARKLWTEHVELPWRAQLQGRLPFDAGSSEESDAAALSAMINPVDGALWKYRTRFEAMAAVDMGGSKFFAPAGMAEFIKSAEALRDALFAAGEKTISVAFKTSAAGLYGALKLP